MNRLLNRLSFRRKHKSPPSTSKGILTPLSCPDLSNFVWGPNVAKADQPKLLDLIMSNCVNFVDDLFWLAQLKRVNRTCNELVDTQLSRITKMDVKRLDFADLDIPFEKEYRHWHFHPTGLRIGARWTAEFVEIVVDEQWTSREVNALCGLLNVLKPYVEEISLDAPIIELVIASLSLLDLDRWYAFQCFLQAINDPNIHINLHQLPLNDRDEGKQHYWPMVTKMIIRTTEIGSIHLARLLDYGVRSHCVVNRRILADLKVQIEGTPKITRPLNRNLYHFRCWAGSAGFDDRFSQQIAINNVS